MPTLDEKLFQIKTSEGAAYGCNQEWYREFWRKKSGCGATAAADIFMYLSRSMPNRFSLCPCDTELTVESAILVMDEMWPHFTPRAMGLNRPEYFAEGVEKVNALFGLNIRPRMLSVPRSGTKAARPTSEEFLKFVSGGLAGGSPVAFLNLSNETLPDVSAWHWVAITALEDGIATLSDEGEKKTAALVPWLERTKKGGGLVFVELF
ncbi:MAG: hypothetical protein LBT20_05265 [Clostridiales bacterium]|jgi:hypothetical protein|nr:hypothetical protein [Clostridiales bacterium]